MLRCGRSSDTCTFNSEQFLLHQGVLQHCASRHIQVCVCVTSHRQFLTAGSQALTDAGIAAWLLMSLPSDGTKTSSDNNIVPVRVVISCMWVCYLML